MPNRTVPPEPEASPTASAEHLLPRWAEWIATNALRHCTQDSMLIAMQGAGENEQEAREAIQSVLQSPIFAASRRLLAQQAQKERKLLSVVGSLQAVWNASEECRQIERRPKIEAQEFRRRHIEGFRPLVLSELAKSWPALQSWQFAALEARYGQTEVQIQSGRSGDASYELNSEALRRQVLLREFLRYAQSQTQDNEHYLTANNHLLRRPEFAALLADIGELPPFAERARLTDTAHLWIGPGGSRTPMHHDCCMLFHTQIVGTKRWRLISPLDWGHMDNRRHVFSPLDLDQLSTEQALMLQGVQVLDVRLEPGETLFVPLGWWHQVESLSPSVSLSYTGMSLPNQFDFFSPQLD